jgi:hypothetical protein
MATPLVAGFHICSKDIKVFKRQKGEKGSKLEAPLKRRDDRSILLL